MIFNAHKHLKDTHAFLSPSKTAWVNYDEDKLIESYTSSQAAALGTRYHALAAELIRLKVPLPKDRSTFNAYVNDALNDKLTPEVVLYYSPLCYGTSDAIGFTERGLVISDLKTGSTPGKMMQLKIYAAIFLLEYGMDQNFNIELKIYQSDQIEKEIVQPHSEELKRLCDKIVRFDIILSTFI